MFGKLGTQSYQATKHNMDMLSNIIENISNVNSIGYKKKQASFLETLNGEITKHENKEFSQGPLRKTTELLDFALDGPGFFEVELPNGTRAYTRAGRFKFNNEGELVTEDGYRILPQMEEDKKALLEMQNKKVEKELVEKSGSGFNVNANELGLNLKLSSPKLILESNLTPEILEDGTLNGINSATGETVRIGKINVVAFNNPKGLEHIGKSYFAPTTSSGIQQEVEPGPARNTKVKQGFLEYGNVDMAAEFMNLAQTKNMLTAQLKILKVIDKIYENVHFTISRAV